MYGEVFFGVKVNCVVFGKIAKCVHLAGDVGLKESVMRFSLRSFTHAMCLAALLCLMPGCAIFKKRSEKPHRTRKAVAAVSTAPQRVGTITLVNEAEHFVLIDTGLLGVPAIGTALKSFTGETESGIVAVGNVNRRPFVVADVVKGAPKKGDVVFR